MIKQFLDPATVLYIIGDGNYSKIHFVSGRPALQCRTLKFYQLLCPTFIRINKGILINPVYVVNVENAKSRYGKVMMRGGWQFTIARRRMKDVREQWGVTSKPGN